MRRVSVPQFITLLLLFGACVYVANIVARYLLKEDGGYAQWSVFTDCSTTCGGGIRIRKRHCNNPVPRYGGNNCSLLGLPTQIFACNRQPCPINGAYGPWEEYQKCLVTCGGGVQIRKRKCNNPEPQHGGKNCKDLELGLDVETRTCNEQKCPVNGGYSEWSKFTDCSKSCGGGVKSRVRTCSNPVPDDQGKNCTELGPSNETKSCNDEPCPITSPTAKPATKPQTEEPKTNTKGTEQPPTTTDNTSKTTMTEVAQINGTNPIKSEQSPTTTSSPNTTESST